MKREYKCGIYRIYCQMNRECYVGSSYQIAKRWHQHRNSLKANSHTSPYLQNAWNKYGAEAFTFKVLEECDRDILHEREQFWIDNLGPKFNSMTTIYPSRRFSEETKATMSVSGKRRWANDEGTANSLVALDAGRATRWASPQTHCKRGHERTSANLTASGACRVCVRAAYEARYAPHPKAIRLFCKNGHPRTPDGKGCKVCSAFRQRQPKPKLCTDCSLPFMGKTGHYCPACRHERMSRRAKEVFNRTPARTGWKHSPETLAKMSATARAQKRTIVNRGPDGRIVKSGGS